MSVRLPMHCLRQGVQRTFESFSEGRSREELRSEAKVIRPTADLVRTSSGNENELTRILVDRVRVDPSGGGEGFALALVQVDAGVEQRVVVGLLELVCRGSLRKFLRQDLPTEIAEL